MKSYGGNAVKMVNMDKMTKLQIYIQSYKKYHKIHKRCIKMLQFFICQKTIS